MLESYRIKLAPTSNRVTVNPSKSDGVAITGNQMISATWNPYNEADKESAETASSIQVEFNDDLVVDSNLGDMIELKVVACHHSKSLLGRTTVYRTTVMTFKAKVVRKGYDLCDELCGDSIVTTKDFYLSVEVIQDSGV